MRHQRTIAILFLVLILLCQLGSPTQAKPPMRVVFINPNPTDSVFWSKSADAMQAAANDLGIQFRHFRTSPWPSEMVSQVRKLLNGPQRPDFLIASINKTSSTNILKVAEQAKVPIFIINSGLERGGHAPLLQPRKNFKYWIGEMLPADRKAGRDLANHLITEARKHNRPAIKMIALEGYFADYAGYQRNLGLTEALKFHSDTTLLQSVTAKWSFEEAYRKTALLLKRYPETTVIWAADDQMALGAIQAIRKSGRIAGKDILVGGVNGEPGSFRAISHGEMSLSLGGHALEGAWAMVLLYDYFHGLDFARERVKWETRLIPVTKANLTRYQTRSDPHRINFRNFSKVYNPRLIDYDFNIQRLIEGP